MTKIKQPYRGTIQCSMALWTTHQCMTLMLLLFKSNPIFSLWIPVMI